MASVSNLQNIQEKQQTSSNQNQTLTKEYYVRVPKSKKRYHALKFHTTNVDIASWTKVDMTRDVSNQQNFKPEWEALPKSGVGSEYGREAKELARRRRYTSKKSTIEDLPWILSNKTGATDKTKEKQYIGKKSVSENSSYFIFVKCSDGGFEAHPLEDWYSFAPHKTYKTLNFEEAEEEYKRRHKILNKYMIMANKRKNEEDEDEEEDQKKSIGKGSGFSLSSKSNKDSWVSDGEDEKKKGKKKNYKSTNLSDDDEGEEDERADDSDKEVSKKTKKSKRKNKESDDEFKVKEDSDDGDHEGMEKDYSSSDSSLDFDYDDKYKEKGIDEEEAIKALDKSSESESDEDEGLTEEGKEYRKLMSKDDAEKESDDFDDFFKGKSSKDDDSKDSSSTFDDSDIESDLGKEDKVKKIKSVQPLASTSDSNKLKRKASDELLQGKKKQNKQQISQSTNHDESSSSSSASIRNPTATKSTKTAAVIAAAAAAAAAGSSTAKNNNGGSKSTKSSDKNETNNSILTEEEVRRYLSRKPITTKELLHKFRGKIQNTMTNQQLVESLRIILDKLKAKMIEKNGVKYLSLP